MITLENITKKYNDTTVLRDINLNIPQGDMVFIIGMSGAGKTTLMKLITREETPSSGKIYIKDSLSGKRTDITTYKPHVYRKKLGIVFQDYKLIERKTIFENIAYPLQVFGESKRDIKILVEKVTNMIGIDYLLDKYPNELSGGEMQRVGIARALVTSPSVILLDEPTGSLDPRTTNEIMNLLKRINSFGTTIIMVTHDINAINTSLGRIIRLHDGTIVQDIRKGGVKNNDKI